MNGRLYLTSVPTPIEPIEELSRVRTTCGVDVGEGVVMPEGSVGTVVYVYGSGEAYSVEFSKPFHALVTIDCGGLVAITEDSRERFVAAADAMADRAS